MSPEEHAESETVMETGTEPGNLTPDLDDEEQAEERRAKPSKFNGSYSGHKAGGKPADKGFALDEPGFADSVIAGLGQTNENDEPGSPPSKGAGDDAPEPEEESDEDGDGPPRIPRSLSDHLAAVPGIVEEERQFTLSDIDAPAADLKHDALAEAVQSALLAVYGDGGRQASAAASPAFRYQAEEGDPQHSEDVILSYFAQPQGGRDSGQAGSDVSPQPYYGAQADHSLRAGEPLAFEAPKPPLYYAPNAAASAAPHQQPVPAFPVPSPQGNAMHDNGRLLGAAGLGLIGGIAFAAVLAVFLINSYDQDSARQGAARPVAQNSAQPEPSKPEITALDVTAKPGAAVPLRISLQSAPPAEQTLVSITGVPQGGRLSSGVDAGGGNWLLPPKRVRGLSLTLPDNVAGPVQLDVQLLDSNVRTPLSEKESFVVRLGGESPSPAAPAARPPAEAATTTAAIAPAGDAGAGPKQNAALSPSAPSLKTQPAPAAKPAAPAAAGRGDGSLTEAEVQDLIREGNRFMREGDILRARELYQRAVKSGNAEAAIAMGRSYDPSYFERLERKTGAPDPAKAFEWYRQAMNDGMERAAQVRIENLKQWLNQ
jgi:TPR repeat protein